MRTYTDRYDAPWYRFLRYGSVILNALAATAFFYIVIKYGERISNNPAHPDWTVAAIVLVISAFQLFIAMLSPRQRWYREHYFVTCDIGKVEDYFSEGEPDALAKKGWEVFQITNDGVLFRR